MGDGFQPGVDGLVLSLHGAIVADGHPDADSEGVHESAEIITPGVEGIPLPRSFTESVAAVIVIEPIVFRRWA